MSVCQENVQKYLWSCTHIWIHVVLNTSLKNLPFVKDSLTVMSNDMVIFLKTKPDYIPCVHQN